MGFPTNFSQPEYAARPVTRILPGERHESGIERQGEQEVTRRHGGHGQYGDKVCYTPVVRDKGGHRQDYHAGDEYHGE